MKHSILVTLATVGLFWGAPTLEPAIAQRVTDLSPAANSQNIAPDSSISAQFAPDNGVEVDPSSVRILINGRDVTSRSTITRSFFTYRPAQPLPPGPVQVQVEYRNTRGEQRTTAWTYTVQQPQAAVQISSVVHSAFGTPQGPGDTFVVTINGTPGATASVLLIQNDRTVRELPAREMSSGVYVATLTLQASDRSEGAVVARLRRQDETIYAAAAQPFSFSATATNGTTGSTGTGSTGTGTTGTGTTGTTGSGSSTGSGSTSTVSLTPRFTSHSSGDSVSSSGFTLVGRTRPNATVDIEVRTAISVLDVVNLGGQTLLDDEVTADSNGEFRVEVPRATIPVPGTEYRIRATAHSGSETATTELRLRQR